MSFNGLEKFLKVAPALKGHFYSKQGLIEVDLEFDQRFGGYIRPGSSDVDMLKDSLKRDYNTLTCTDKICLDLGANIGGFVLKASREKAKWIVAYEPEPYNFEMLVHNAKLVETLGIATNLNQAAIGKALGRFDLIINPGKNSACSASLNIKPNKRRVRVPVDVHSFRAVLDTVKPQIVKMDIEGAEYAILRELDNAPYVTDLAIELHGFSKENERLMHEAWKKLSSEWNIVIHDEKVAFQKVALMTAHLTR